MDKWKHQRTQGVVGVDEQIRWHLEGQYLIGGDMDLNMWVVITTASRQSSKKWAGCTLTAQQLDDPVVVVTISEAMAHMEQGRVDDSLRCIELLNTL